MERYITAAAPYLNLYEMQIIRSGEASWQPCSWDSALRLPIAWA